MRTRFANCDYEPESRDYDDRVFSSQRKVGEATNEDVVEAEDDREVSSEDI